MSAEHPFVHRRRLGDAWTLRTLDDYARAAREASEMVRRVYVADCTVLRSVPRGVVQVTVRRSWGRRLPERELRRVHEALAERIPLGTGLTVR